MEVKPLQFKAILNKATTTIDGGWRISFDVSQDDSQAIMILSQLRESLLELSVSKVD